MKKGTGMSARAMLALVVLFSCSAAAARAGLYYSGETYARLPSRWPGFLLDQRLLRTIAVPPSSKNPASTARQQYLERVRQLQDKSAAGNLSADELADLGALYVRLGEPRKAVTLLREAQRRFPEHFRITANLGTAWQVQGDLAQAAAQLQHAVRLAPATLKPAEQYHLKLVRLRLEEGKKSAGIDRLFDVRFVNSAGKYEPGVWDPAERKKLPANALAMTQQLALWLPADGRLLWLLAELAAVHGDVRSAAAMMDGCVTQFGLDDPELRRHRSLCRAAADLQPRGTIAEKSVHQGHTGTSLWRSRRPLISRPDAVPLPPIDPNGTNELPWEVLARTSVSSPFRPVFDAHLRALDGRRVAVQGFIQPMGEGPEMDGFLLIAYPVGCWYCEMPEITSIVYVALPAGKTMPHRPGLVRVVGRLQLNRRDPEDFLYAVRDARVGGVD
jgi:hypothetical protein